MNPSLAHAVERPLLPVMVYAMRGTPRRHNAMFEGELVKLLGRGAVSQVIVTMAPPGFWVAVLPRERLITTYRRVSGRKAKVTTLHAVRVETEGFAPLFSARHRRVRIYRSLDTLIKSLARCGPLPTITIRQGAIA